MKIYNIIAIAIIIIAMVISGYSRKKNSGSPTAKSLAKTAIYEKKGLNE